MQNTSSLALADALHEQHEQQEGRWCPYARRNVAVSGMVWSLFRSQNTSGVVCWLNAEKFCAPVQ